MTVKPWKVLESNYLRKNLRVDRCELPNGKILEAVIHEYGTWVTVVPITRGQEVVLVRQYRHGIQRATLELPGGVMDDGDGNPMQAAKRELLEETGYASETFVEIGKVAPNPANQTNWIHFFLALDAERLEAQNLDETEDIEISLMPLDEVITMAKNGSLLHSLHVTALFFAMAHLKRIV